MSHFIEKCQYGKTHSQCRCSSPSKSVRQVQCNTPLAHAPEGQLDSSAGVIFHEDGGATVLPTAEGPEDGHTFRISVVTRGSYSVEGIPGHTDSSEFMGPSFNLDVRAWNLPDALRKAADHPLADWVHGEGWPSEEGTTDAPLT